MTARFKRRESVRNGFQRIAARHLDGILADLSGNGQPPNIHTARKRCKFLRALLRLVREGLDEADFRTENIRLRDLARTLSAARDAQVRLRIFGQLLALPGAPPADPYGPLHDWLRREVAATRLEMLNAKTLAGARAAVRQGRAHLDRVQLAHRGWRLLASGLGRSYRAARCAFRAAVNAPSDAAHHEWRKRVKTLWHHIGLLRCVHPRKLGALAEQLDALGELLGDDHDLAVLQAHLVATGAPRIAVEDFAMLEALIAHRRDSLIRVAQKLGVLACGEKPRIFLRRMHGWWLDWRK